MYSHSRRYSSVQVSSPSASGMGISPFIPTAVINRGDYKILKHVVVRRRALLQSLGMRLQNGARQAPGFQSCVCELPTVGIMAEVIEAVNVFSFHQEIFR